MKADYSEHASEILHGLSPNVRNAFFKQVRFLEQNLKHPSLHAKKYDESQDLWQARVNKDWRFYFQILDDIYYIVTIIPHPEITGGSLGRILLRRAFRHKSYYHTPMPEKLTRGTTGYVCECGKKWAFPIAADAGTKTVQPCDCGRMLVLENGIVYGKPGDTATK